MLILKIEILFGEEDSKISPSKAKDQIGSDPVLKVLKKFGKLFTKFIPAIFPLESPVK